MEREERRKWDLRNYDVNRKCKRISFDNHSYTESEQKLRKRGNKVMIDWIPFSEFELREAMLGRKETAAESWKEMFERRTHKFRKVGKEWTLAVFKGMRDTAGWSEVSVQEWSRQQSLGNVDAMDEAKKVLG